MKHPMNLSRSISALQRLACLPALLFCSGAFSGLHAANWYLQANHGLSSDWNTLAEWWSQPSGGGTHPASISASDSFFVNGFQLRTPQTSASVSFAGGSLNLNGGSILVKQTGSNAVTIPQILSKGGGSRALSNGTGGIQVLNFGNLTVTDSETTAFSTGGATRGLNLTVNTLQGGGDLNLQGGGTVLLGITSGSQFYGTLYVTGSTTFTAQSAISTSGALVIEAGSKVNLNQNITVTSLVVGGTTNSTAGLAGLKKSGTVYASNTTYTFAQLQAAFPAIFLSGSGSITVTQPKLTVDAAQVVNTVGLGQLGVNLGAGKFWNSVSPNYRADMEKLRVGMVRTPTYPAKGYTLQDMDIRVAQILNAGGTPLFIQSITKPAPPFTTEQQAFTNALLDLNGNPGGTVATNAAFLVQRYKAPPYNLTTQVWEVGNEPDISIDYQVANPQEYITYYQSVHNQLVASGLRDSVKLCGPVVAFEYGFAANGNRTDNILNAFFAQCGTPLNGFNQVDILTRHVYPFIYDWETSAPKTTDTAYNLLNAPCEQVTFTQAQVPPWTYRGEGAIQAKLNQNGFPSTVGTGITEMNVSGSYRHTITQGLWFLTYNHFALYNPRSVLSTGFVFDSTSNNFSYYKSDKTPSFGYWATYVHNLLTGDEILAQNSSDPHLLVTATRDDSYVYLQVVNRNDVDMAASVDISNAPVAASTKATLYELTATANPETEFTTNLGLSFTYTFPAMTARVFRYLRSDAPVPVTPPGPPVNVVLDTTFDSAPAGLQTYYTGFQPVVTGGNLKLTNTTSNMTAAAVFNGQALSSSKKRMQAKFGYRIDSGHAGTGFVFGAYSSNPGVAGNAGTGLGFQGQPNILWGVKIQNKGAEPDQIGIVPNIVSAKVDGLVSQPLTPYPWGYAMDMFVVVDYDGDAGTVRARLYQGSSEAGTLAADLTNRLGNPSTLPAGTVFGFTGSTTNFSEITLIQNLLITADDGSLLPPLITSASTAMGTAGSPFSYQITADNSPSSFGATGLPSGLSVNTSTGLISGTPGAAGTYNVTLSATNSAGTGTLPILLTVSASGGLPSPWAAQDIGSFTPAGTASHSGGTFTVTTGSGTNLMDGYTTDKFTYVYQPASGDCDITARVGSLVCGDTIKGGGGVMIRETLAANSPFVLTSVTTGRGLQFGRRTMAGAAIATTAGPAGVAPQWVRIIRVGNTFTSYRSPDNVTWTQVGAPQTITMGSSVYIGLPVCNHGGTGTATFTNVAVNP